MKLLKEDGVTKTRNLSISHDAMTRLISLLEIPVDAVRKHVLDEERMRFIADFEDVFGVDVAEALEGGLKVVQPLTEIALSREDDGLHSVVSERNLFCLRH